MRLVQSCRMLRLRAILVDPETLPYLHALGQVETPTCSFDETPETPYTEEQTITFEMITCATDGATIYITVNGGEEQIWAEEIPEEQVTIDSVDPTDTPLTPYTEEIEITRNDIVTTPSDASIEVTFWGDTYDMMPQVFTPVINLSQNPATPYTATKRIILEMITRNPSDCTVWVSIDGAVPAELVPFGEAPPLPAPMGEPEPLEEPELTPHIGTYQLTPVYIVRSLAVKPLDGLEYSLDGITYTDTITEIPHNRDGLVYVRYKGSVNVEGLIENASIGVPSAFVRVAAGAVDSPEPGTVDLSISNQTETGFRLNWLLGESTPAGYNDRIEIDIAYNSNFVEGSYVDGYEHLMLSLAEYPDSVDIVGLEYGLIYYIRARLEYYCLYGEYDETSWGSGDIVLTPYIEPAIDEDPETPYTEEITIRYGADYGEDGEHDILCDTANATIYVSVSNDGGATWITDDAEWVQGPEVAVQTPAILPADSDIYTDTDITITCGTSGAAIYYTTNGITPTEASTLYEGAFNLGVGESQAVKARAYKTAYNPSEVATANYNVTEPPAGEGTFDETFDETFG